MKEQAIAAFEENEAQCTIKTAELFGYSTEGGQIIGYFIGDEIIKMETEFFGEMGKFMDIIYFYEGYTFWEEKAILYQVPIYIDSNVQIAKTELSELFVSKDTYYLVNHTESIIREVTPEERLYDPEFIDICLTALEEAETQVVPTYSEVMAMKESAIAAFKGNEAQCTIKRANLIGYTTEGAEITAYMLCDEITRIEGTFFRETGITTYTIYLYEGYIFWEKEIVDYELSIYIDSNVQIARTEYSELFVSNDIYYLVDHTEKRIQRLAADKKLSNKELLSSCFIALKDA